MKRVLSSIVVAGTTVVALGVTTGPAQAESYKCAAASGSGLSCPAVDNQAVKQVRSIRLNGDCLVFSTEHRYLYWGYLAISTTKSSPTVLTYSTKTCDGGTQNRMDVLWNTKPDKGNFLWIHIKAPGAAWK